MNPYEVLGVSENDSPEAIKKAYRDLVKKYHPDKYVNNPLADLAGEKLKEINKAYEMITNGTSSVSYSSPKSSAGRNTSYTSGTSADFQNARAMISAGRLNEAEQILSRLERNAEWNYLMGIIYLRRGWSGGAEKFFRTAVGMEPGNTEYVNTFNSFRNAGRQYRRTYHTPSVNADGCFCDCCTKLICADLCCECMGGDLITCC